MKILVAVDGSSYTRKMLAYLAAHDEWLGGVHEYTVFTAVPSIPPRAAASLDRETLRTYYDDEAEKIFKPVRTFFKRQGIQATFVGKHGNAGDMIAQTANKGDFDLLVMGSHGHGALGALVMGSVSAKVLASTTVPVLLVR